MPSRHIVLLSMHACLGPSQAPCSRPSPPLAATNIYRVGPWRCSCLVTWFCYQLIAKPGKKTTAPPWPEPYVDDWYDFSWQHGRYVKTINTVCNNKCLQLTDSREGFLIKNDASAINHECAYGKAILCDNWKQDWNACATTWSNSLKTGIHPEYCQCA